MTGDFVLVLDLQLLWALPRPAPRRGGREAALGCFRAQGLSASLRQGLPGRYASSVLSLDSVPAPLSDLCFLPSSSGFFSTIGGNGGFY